jgi:hypothetical protein
MNKLGQALGEVQVSCGGEQALAFQLHITTRVLQNYRSGHTRPRYLVCLQLARICKTLDGPNTPRDVDYWMDLAGRGAPAKP